MRPLARAHTRAWCAALLPTRPRAQALQAAEAEAATLREELSQRAALEGEVQRAPCLPPCLRATCRGCDSRVPPLCVSQRPDETALTSAHPRAARCAPTRVVRTVSRAASLAQLQALQAKLAASRASAERLSAERDRLLEISNRLRADLNRVAEAGDVSRGVDGSEPTALGSRASAMGLAGEVTADVRVDALEAAMAALAAHTGQLGPLRARAREHATAAHGSGGAGSELLEVEPLESALRASATSLGSSNRSTDGRGARTRAGEARITLAGSASMLAGRPVSGSASERETASQQSARERERQRQRADAARKRSLVPNYNRLSAAESEHKRDAGDQTAASPSPQRL